MIRAGGLRNHFGSGQRGRDVTRTMTIDRGMDFGALIQPPAQGVRGLNSVRYRGMPGALHFPVHKAGRSHIRLARGTPECGVSTRPTDPVAERPYSIDSECDLDVLPQAKRGGCATERVGPTDTARILPHSMHGVYKCGWVKGTRLGGASSLASKKKIGEKNCGQFSAKCTTP